MKFQRKKFLSLPIKRQHKKCAEILREIYGGCDRDCELFDHYNEIQEWMGQESVIHSSKEEISNRFHAHLKKAGFYLQESDFLPTIRKGDKCHAPGEQWPITIYLDRIRSAHNIGSILRTTEAFSLGSVKLPTGSQGSDHPQVQKASMGTWKDVSCEKIETIHSLPRPWIALETSPQAVPLSEFIFPEVFTLIVGNEEFGCSEEIVKQCDYLVEIPLRGRKNSLNVANAFAIAGAEISRQRD